jgi:hypothetical protein
MPTREPESGNLYPKQRNPNLGSPHLRFYGVTFTVNIRTFTTFLLETHLVIPNLPESRTLQFENVKGKMSLPNYQTAACIDKPGPGARLDLRHDIPVPVPKAGEVLIKLEWTGFW